MAGLTSIDAVYIVLVFIVPGYIYLSVRNQFVPGQERPPTDSVLSFVTFGALNFAVFGWIVYLAISYAAPPYIKVAAWVATLVAIPALLGLASGISAQFEIGSKIYKAIGLNPIHPTPRAWERVFYNTAGSWVFITLKNGTTFAGYWGGESFASSDSKERDLYIAEIFEVQEDGSPWKPTGKGLFVAAGEIRTIEFTPLAKEKRSGTQYETPEVDG